MADSKTLPQTGQVAKITTGLGTDMAFLEGFTFTESLSDAFRLSCDVVCASPYSFGEQRGTAVSIVVKSGSQDGATLQDRAFHGVLTEAALVDAMEGEYRFRLTARPWFWVLSLGRDCRIFPKKTARQIITDVFEAAGVATSQYDMSGLSERGTIEREYCVQFEESDFAFLSRLMEEEGIYYFFEHTATAHVMHLCDSSAAHKDFAGGDLVVGEENVGLNQPHLTAFGSYVRPTVASYAMRDQHWKMFGDMRDAKAEVEQMAGQITPKIFEYPGGFAYLTDDGATDGADFAKMRLEAENAEGLVHAGEGGTFAVATGGAVEIQWNGTTAKMLVIGTTHRLSGQQPLGQDSPTPDLSVEIETINFQKAYRPQRLTPKPVARGPQVATVVGEAKKEVDPDAAGRVRVQFPWDRSGRTNEKCSCWIRVSSSWAGPGLGESFLPRIGHEVLVSYIDGDMDRPIITGRVYNSKNTVYAAMESCDLTLPAQHATSGWITQTIEGKSTSDYDGAVEPPSAEPGYNALLFVDTSGAEKLYFRAQRDLYGVTYRDVKYRTHRDVKIGTGRNLDTEVETGDETHTVTKGKRTTSIKMDETLTVTDGNQTTTVSKGNKSLTVSQGNQTITVDQGNQSTTVSIGDIKIDATAGNITISAAQSIELKVGATTSIKLDPASITLKAAMINSEATANNTVKGSALVIVQGGLVKIN